MIYTLTLNPCIDKTVIVDRLERGSLNRVKSSRLDAAGKGINVSSVMAAFGIKSVPIAAVGGDSGRFIGKVLADKGFDPELIWIDRETRTNMKVVETDGTLTEINEPGPYINETQYACIRETLYSLVKADDTLVVAGSLPPGIPKAFYREIAEVFKDLGARVVIDADGEALDLALSAAPYIVKPNLFELEGLAGRHLNSEDEVLLLIKEILNRGVEVAIVSLGAKGAVFAAKGECWRVYSTKIEPRSTVGCGDTLLGGFLAGLFMGAEFKECCCMAVSAATAKALKEGTQLPEINEVGAVRSIITAVSIVI